jgi:hypothetical protein
MRTLVTFGLGALTMYLLDSEQGPRRRALLRERLTDAKRAVRERAAAKARDVDLDADQISEAPAGAHHLGR